ncbi:hypothetical protein C8J56DRAFT_903264 [Mycena floridula]|nr:hypothetical protein C8J56DRAFT_903264 [Mycena floridula]
MGVSLPEHEALCAASAKFITDEKFGAPQLENVMETVFGPYAGQQGNPEAETWKKYDDINLPWPQPNKNRRAFVAPKLNRPMATAGLKRASKEQSSQVRSRDARAIWESQCITPLHNSKLLEVITTGFLELAVGMRISSLSSRTIGLSGRAGLVPQAPDEILVELTHRFYVSSKP